jgi:hypothetical protein
VKKAVKASLSEPVLYGSGAGDDIVSWAVLRYIPADCG